jgi:hypothetical protein
MIDTSTVRKKIILFENELWVVDDVYTDTILMSKLESDSEVEEFGFDYFESIKFDFEMARIDAVNIMNQTRFFDNVISKEKDNVVM